MILVFFACTRFAPVERGEVCPDDPTLADPSTFSPPDLVMVVSVDTLHRGFLGVHHPEWNVTPNLDAFMAEGARLDHVVVPRGLSAPSMGTMMTGTYPRTHGQRANEEPEGTIFASTPTLAQRFAELGYRTWGFSANMCFVMTEEEQFCTWSEEIPGIGQAQGDALLVRELLARLGPEPSFVWLHLMDPHDPYTRRNPWYSEFHPETYEGPFEDPSEEVLAGVMSGETAYTEEDRRHVEAVYASQVRATDVLLGELFEGLGDRMDDSIIVFAVDHGDELARRSSYFYHGCSPYDGVIDVTWAIRAPGRLAAGEVLAHRIPSVDVAPTVLALAGHALSGPSEGRSMVDELQACVEPDRNAFFERGKETAGVVSDGWKYFLSPREGYSGCTHYSSENPFPNQREELYDLANDPLELDNRVPFERERVGEMRRKVCTWVNAASWDNDPDNALLAACGGG